VAAVVATPAPVPSVVSSAAPAATASSVGRGALASAETLSQPTPTSAGLPCTSADLAGDLVLGSGGGGAWSGALIIRDSSKFDCTVRARVVVAGYTQAGRVIALVRAVGDLAVDMPLRPSSPNVAGEQLPPGRYLVIDLWGRERDDVSQPDGLCRQQDEIAPATFATTLAGAHVTVRNLALDGGAMDGCHGRIDATYAGPS
jgi:hypothetical protein